MDTTFFQVDEKLAQLSDKAEERAAKAFRRVEEITSYNQQKVLSAFIRHQVSESHFVPTTGYGYGDRGRDALDAILADIMGAEDALIRHSIVSGTHAITIALFGILRPGDTLLAATGAPYDTLEDVIGHKSPSMGSLAEYGVKYRQVDLNKEERPDLPAIQEALQADPSVKMVHIQRSRGYATRPSLSIAEIERIVHAVRAVREDVVIFVDNCYGEFVEKREPNEVGADLIAGSLIKNPGGGIAENGGYLCGTKACIEQCSYRMTTPGLGREVGASLGHNRSLYMGLFQAPHV
ncbi:MAG: methionine gamma-lyase family protein, partial [Clostridia bacterium]|nr:methionine gamma-lyase family protein [Clostridia bacterium]